ncbi:MAG: SusC/RagA family TonB-linked outer membrane protein [Pseudobacter sp.]|uniref:SusC/RagA family TonB-linked outer membrane protein n=1 Tax=Pseudobacter sp. TaxID=2045420 RepID=UPI003F7EE16E
MIILSFKPTMLAALLVFLCTAGSSQELKRDTSKVIYFIDPHPKVRKLLLSIEKQSGFSFNFNHENIHTEATIILPNSSLSVNVLVHLIAVHFNVSVKFEDSYIVFVKKDATEAPGVPEQTGWVFDEEQNPISAVSIRVLDASGSPGISGSDGSFKYLYDPKHNQLEFSKPGYQTKEVSPEKYMPLSVIMKRAANQMTEVIVPGIATTRTNSVGAVASIEGRGLPTGYNNNLFSGLQGKTPGLLITDASGAPGSTVKILIRGQQSIGLLAGFANLPANNPLILVNGVIWPTANQPLNRLRSMLGDPEIFGQQNGLGNLNCINPADIEKIEIYKDADATAIYGTRGAHGVISIWTKKGDVGGALRYNIKAMRGLAFSAFRPRLMNTEQYAAMRRDAIINGGLPVDASTAPDLFLWPLDRNTNWADYMIGNTARTQQYYFSASGGIGKQFSVYCGAGFQEESSVLPLKLSNKMGTFHVNAFYSPGKKSSTQFSFLASHSQNQQPAIDPMVSLIRLAPNAPAVTDAQGKYVYEENGLEFTNIRAQLLNWNEAKTFTIHASLYSEYALAKRFFLKIRLGLNNIQLNENSFYPIQAYHPKSGMTGTVETASSTYMSTYADPQLQYIDSSRSIKTITVTLGATYQSRNDNWNSIHLGGFPSDNLMGEPSAATSTQRDGNENVYRYAALYGGFRLTLQEKYIFNITGRIDGSSNLSPENRFAAFGAIGAGWIFSNTTWMKDHAPFITFGKLRASIGTTGNDNAGGASYKDKYKLQTDAIPYGGIIAINPVSLANLALGWEQNLKREFALDLETDAGVSLTFAWYHNITSRQLVGVSIPAQVGYTHLSGVNHSAKVLNSGLELWVDVYRKIFKRIKWSSELSLTLPRNRLKEFANLETSLYNRSLVIGKSLTEQQAFLFKGVNPTTGLSEFINIAGDVNITKPEDMTSIGNLDPAIYGGWNNKLTYGQFELSFLIEGKVQNNINPKYFGYLYQPGNSNPEWLTNQSVAFVDRWRLPGDVSGNQKVSISQDPAFLQPTEQLMASNKMLVDGSYLRIRYLGFSWTAPRHWSKRFSLSTLKLYLRMQNIVTITGYSGSDPTIQSPLAMPSVRSFLAGLEIGF